MSIKTKKIWVVKSSFCAWKKQDVDVKITTSPVKLYIDTPDGKLYFTLSYTGVLARKYQSHTDYIIRNNANVDIAKFNQFLKGYYLWEKVIIRDTKNGLFLFIQLDDGHYGEPAFKLYR